MLQGVVYLK